MVVATRLLLLLAIAGASLAQQRSLSTSTRRRNRLPAGKSEVLDFSCPEDFGYYQHPTDCTQYYVCVFGGALQESCSGGLVYSHDLQTCDWPRNVVCNVDLAGPVSTVRITDPRTSEPPRQRGQGQSLTPSVSSNGFAETFRTSAGRSQDQQQSGPSSTAVNRQGRIIQGQSDVQQQQPIRERFQGQESTNRAAFSIPQTTSRTVSFPPPLPGFSSSPSSSPSSPPSPPSPGLEPRPISSPFLRGSQQSQSVTPAPVELEPNFYSDLLNLTDDEYFYLYDDLLLEDYFDATATTTTPRSVSRSPIRDRERFTPIRETEGTMASRSPSSISQPSFTQTRGNSITTEDRTSFSQTQSFPETRGSSSSSSSGRSSGSSDLARDTPSPSSPTTTFSQTRSNSITSEGLQQADKSISRDGATPNRGPPLRSQSRAQSSSTSPSSRTNTKSSSQPQGKVSTDSSRPARLTVKPVSEVLKNTNHLINNVWKYPPRR